jgi:hypothetical protein
VECEIREANRIHAAGPTLMRPAGPFDPTADVRLLGTSISTTAFPHAKDRWRSTESSAENCTVRFHCSTCHLSPNGNGKRTSGTDQAHDVTLPGNATMAELRTTITENETNCQIAVDSSQKAIDTTREQSEMDPKKLEFLQRQKDNAKEQISFFENLAKSLKHWQPLDNRVVGHAVLSPPIAVGKPHNCMMDWCMYEIDTHKLEYFSGNVVDLGTKISAERLVQVMNPNHKFV